VAKKGKKRKMKDYRHGVVGVFINENGLLLGCERQDRLAAWQLPQGGIDKGESADQAIIREMEEELGTDKFEVVRAGAGKTSYDFPADLKLPITKNFRGQIHSWYLLRFLNKAEPNLSVSDKEFVNWCWMSAEELIAATVHWKKEAYRNGLKILGLYP